MYRLEHVETRTPTHAIHFFVDVTRRAVSVTADINAPAVNIQ